MRTFLGIIIIAAANLGPSATAQATDSSKPDEARAISLMADIRPQSAVAHPFLMIHGDDCHGVWGNFFGDNEPAALIGVEPRGNAKVKKPVQAELMLLLWDKQWQVVQRLGKMDPMPESRYASDYSPWTLKQRKDRDEVFLLGRMDLNTSEDKLSWRLDVATHRLAPTGWPKDAVPSISGDTITFSRFQPGKGPSVNTICRYDGKVGNEIITITDEYDSKHVPTVTMTLPASPEKAAVSWRIRAKSSGYYPTHDLYELCRTSPPDKGAAFVAQAELICDWGEEHGDLSAARYLFHRLTGLGRASFDGSWDEDNSRKLLIPKRAAVTGDAEAAHLFELQPK